MCNCVYSNSMAFQEVTNHVISSYTVVTFQYPVTKLIHNSRALAIYAAFFIPSTIVAIHSCLLCEIKSLNVEGSDIRKSLKFMSVSRSVTISTVVAIQLRTRHSGTCSWRGKEKGCFSKNMVGPAGVLNASQVSRMPSNKQLSQVPGKLHFWQWLLQQTVHAHKYMATTYLHKMSYINYVMHFEGGRDGGKAKCQLGERGSSSMLGKALYYYLKNSNMKFKHDKF